MYLWSSTCHYILVVEYGHDTEPKKLLRSFSCTFIKWKTALKHTRLIQPPTFFVIKENCKLLLL